MFRPNAGYSMYSITSRGIFLKIVPFRGRDQGLHRIRGLWASANPLPKRHLDWFSPYSTVHVRDQQTHGQTDRPRYNGNNRPQLDA